jgi:uncharacterized protein YlaI
MASATLIAPAERITPADELDLGRTYTCPQCEHVLRVTGLGRHRVFFEMDNERLDDPVMNRVCPECGHRLPGKGSA